MPRLWCRRFQPPVETRCGLPICTREQPQRRFGVTRSGHLDAFGSIDILVNNAGATKRGEFEDLADDDWQDGFALKFFGAVRLTRAAWPQLGRYESRLRN